MVYNLLGVFGDDSRLSWWHAGSMHWLRGSKLMYIYGCSIPRFIQFVSRRASKYSPQQKNERPCCGSKTSPSAAGPCEYIITLAQLRVHEQEGLPACCKNTSVVDSARLSILTLTSYLQNKVYVHECIVLESSQWLTFTGKWMLCFCMIKICNW